MKTTPRRPKTSKAKSSHGKRGKGPQKKLRAAARRKKHQPSAPVSAPAENPRALELARRIAALALDKKALDVVILDVRGMTSYADYFVIASGESERQVSAIGEHIEVTLKNEQDARVIGSEGRETGNWVLLDYGEVVAHLFYADQRAFYDLEGLWADAKREVVAG